MPEIVKADVVARAKALIARAKSDPKLKAKLDKANADLLRIKAVAGTTHSDQTLSNISIQYKNWDFIGGLLMPTVAVPIVSGRYATYSKRDRLATPSDAMANRATPNEVSENRSYDTFACLPYALKNHVDAAQLAAQDAPLNEMIDLVAAINDGLALNQEKRHATVLTTAANFGYSTTLAGTAQWSDYTTGVSSPYADIAAARDSVWNPMQGETRLVGYCPLAVYNKLRRHPQIVTDFKHQMGLKLPNRQDLANYFDLDDLLVAQGMEDTANEGQTEVDARIWGKVFGIVRVAKNPGPRTASFGSTLQFGPKVTSQWFDPEVGVKGGYKASVGFEACEKVTAPQAGALILAAVA